MVLFIYACGEQQKVSDIIPAKPKTEKDTKTALGRKLQNLYKVSLMTQAYQNVRAQTTGLPTLNIRTTHYYVKFMPADSTQLDVLEADTTLRLYEYPLDYELPTEESVEYREAAIPVRKPTWQYTTVPANYSFPQNISYQIIDPLYIPELDLQIGDGKKINPTYDVVVDSLESQAFRLTGNKLDNTNAKRRQKWNPSGRIRVEDNTMGDTDLRLIPVHGCKVRARRWFNIQEVITNLQGFFYIDHEFRRDVNYAIFWERNDYDIRSGNLGQAWLNGPKMTAVWNMDIRSQKQGFYATIHRAACDYYYHNPFGINTPPEQKWYRSKIKIGAHDKDNDDSNGDFAKWRNWLTWPHIRIYNPTRPKHQIYGTTSHELAHASHWELSTISDFVQADDDVVESWARGVQWMFTNNKYNALGFTPFNHFQGWQDLTSLNELMLRGYTPVAIDLIDNRNQRAENNGSTLYANDRVTGFTLLEVENALRGSRTLEVWRDKLRLLNRVPQRDLDELFQFYIDL
jgi:hypothetical protein